MKTKEINPPRDDVREFEAVEKSIKYAFREVVYLPLLKELIKKHSKIRNSSDALKEAIASGRIYYVRGQFRGKFSSTLSRELRGIGASWDRTHGSWKVPLSKIPFDIRNAISVSQSSFEQMATKVDDYLRNVLPEQLSEKINLKKVFDSTLWRTDQKIAKSLRGITLQPELTEYQRSRISEEWATNMNLSIKDFAEKEIIDLRKNIQAKVMKGERYESMIDTIQKSYGVSSNKAKFIARQETRLLITKFKQTRYQEAGSKQYRWKCVAGSGNHPVRPMHKIHDNKVYSWDEPPIVNEKGERKNPGQDYGCRCNAIPIVRF